MDQQKTGQLIAQRRKELNMTQKQLAEKVGVSDRAISKWERGLGFPDVSLIEPLADALDLTLTELFLGQRQIPVPTEETSAREVLRFTIPKIKRYKRLLWTLAVLLILLSSILLITTAGSSDYQRYSQISAAEAVSITQDILITQDDLALFDCILADPELGSYYEPYPLWKDIARFTLEDEEARAFTGYFDALGLELQYAGIEIYGNSITVIYATANTSVYLDYHADDVSKTIVISEIPIWDKDGQLIPPEHRYGDRIDLCNENNKLFYRGGYTTGWLEYLTKKR